MVSADYTQACSFQYIIFGPVAFNIGERYGCSALCDNNLIAVCLADLRRYINIEVRNLTRSTQTEGTYLNFSVVYCTVRYRGLQLIRLSGRINNDVCKSVCLETRINGSKCRRYFKVYYIVLDRDIRHTGNSGDNIVGRLNVVICDKSIYLTEAEDAGYLDIEVRYTVAYRNCPNVALL